MKISLMGHYSWQLRLWNNSYCSFIVMNEIETFINHAHFMWVFNGNLINWLYLILMVFPHICGNWCQVCVSSIFCARHLNNCFTSLLLYEVCDCSISYVNTLLAHKVTTNKLIQQCCVFILCKRGWGALEAWSLMRSSENIT